MDYVKISALLAGFSEHWTYTENFSLQFPLQCTVDHFQYNIRKVHPTKIWEWWEDWIPIIPRQKRKSVFSFHLSWNSAQVSRILYKILLPTTNIAIVIVKEDAQISIWEWLPCAFSKELCTVAGGSACGQRAQGERKGRGKSRLA